MNLMNRLRGSPESGQLPLPEFHPMTVIRDLGNGHVYRLQHALSGNFGCGATGSGKSSGPAKFIAYGFLAHSFGGLVLCAKKSEKNQWVKWAQETGREDDLIIVDKSGKWRFNFLDWEAQRPGEGGGLTINIVSILMEIARAVAGNTGRADGGSGDGKFFEDALYHMLLNLVDLPLFAKLPVTMQLLRSIVLTAPMNLQEVKSKEYRETSTCGAIIREADKTTAQGDEYARSDFEECRNYWEFEFPTLSEKTRGIVLLMASILFRPFLTRPLGRIFTTDTNVTPEMMFAGKIIIVDLPTQEMRLVGRCAQLAFKFCAQVAIMRRQPPIEGSFQRPVFIFADECQNFITEFDAEYQAVARGSGGCTVYLTQNLELLRGVLGNDDKVNSLIANLQNIFICQNSSVSTNEWSAELLGARWVEITSGGGHAQSEGHAGTSWHSSQQRRHYIEPAEFATLKRGGELNNFKVQSVLYMSGTKFPGPGGEDELPYAIITFDQR